jgi:hypothetical protein
MITLPDPPRLRRFRAPRGRLQHVFRYHITYVIDAGSWRPTVVERETGTRISRRWRGRADRGRIAWRSIFRSIDMRRVAVAVRDLLPACVPVRQAVAARSPRAARHAARWRVVGFSSRAVAADARSDRSRSRCRPLSRDQHDHETSSSHRDRGRIPRITATDDSAYDSARPPLSLRGVSTTPYSRGSRRTGSCYLHLPGDAGPGRDAR